MGERVNLQSRRALLKQFSPQYREASSAQKHVLLIPLPKSQAIIAAIGCGCSTMPRTGCMRLRTHVRAITGQKSNTHCSWNGMRPIASAPNV